MLSVIKYFIQIIYFKNTEYYGALYIELKKKISWYSQTKSRFTLFDFLSGRANLFFFLLPPDPINRTFFLCAEDV